MVFQFVSDEEQGRLNKRDSFSVKSEARVTKNEPGQKAPRRKRDRNCEIGPFLLTRSEERQNCDQQRVFEMGIKQQRRERGSKYAAQYSVEVDPEIELVHVLGIGPALGDTGMVMQAAKVEKQETKANKDTVPR